jgi:hypothetical protein
MAESNTKTNGTKTIALNVRLRPAEHTNLPVIANYTDINVTQGIAYLNFGFIEPALLIEVGKQSPNGGAVPKHMDGSLMTRVALPLHSLLRLQQQLSQTLVGLSEKVSRKS